MQTIVGPVTVNNPKNSLNTKNIFEGKGIKSTDPETKTGDHIAHLTV